MTWMHKHMDQGQQRTTALSIKLAEIELMNIEVGEYPILLLDDVLSELDDSRQTHLLSTIQHKVQTFVTTTSVDGIDHEIMNNAKLYRISQGELSNKKVMVNTLSDVNNTDNYGAGQIQVLEGLEAVRKRPGMYIGSTSKEAHHLVWEIVDNSIDEALAGYANQIEVVIEKDNWIKVTTMAVEFQLIFRRKWDVLLSKLS